MVLDLYKAAARRIGTFYVAVAFVLCVAVAQASTPSEEGRRLALVVGNAAYDHVYSLKNPVNDADAIAETLENLGFEVTIVTDVGKDSFEAAIEAFRQSAQGAEATVLYFSGHGFQLNGVNYLVPTDAKLDSREVIEERTLRLDSIIAALGDRGRQSLIFLDACRNNPLPQSVRGNYAADGLAQIETGTGTYVAFATQPGNITRDGAGDNSPFAEALIEHMQEPGISVFDMMIRVRNTVEENTLQQQTPWEQSSLRAQFFFNPQEEGGDELTEDDKALLMALDPALRKKFEQRFGITIEAVGDEDETDVDATESEPIIARIQTNMTIETVIEDAGGTAAPAPGEGAVAEGGAETPDAVAEAPGADDGQDQGSGTVVARLQILPDAGTPDTPTPLADTQAPGTVTTGEPDAAPDAAYVPPLPTPRPETETVEPQVIARLDPSASQPNRAEAIEPAGQPVDNAVRTDAERALPPISSQAVAPVNGTARVSLGARDSDVNLKPVTTDRFRIVGEEVEPKTAEPPKQLASLDPSQTTPDSLVDPDTPITEAPEDLPKAIQAELARLGCYRSTIDGIWGPRSAKALLRYYATKKLSPDDLDPNMALYSKLQLEENVICKTTEIKRDKPSKSASKPTRSKSRKAKPTRKKSEPVAKRRVPKPKKATTAKKPSKSSGGRRTISRKRLGTGVFR